MRDFHRRPLLAGLAAFAAAGAAKAALPNADAAVVGDVARYLDGVRSLRARFDQLANGQIAKGRVALQRPGRLRFDYDPPSQILLVTNDWRLIFQDASVKQINVVPVSETPLGFLLGDRVTLDGAVTVTRVLRRAGEVAVQLVRTGKEGEGDLVIYLAERPMELRRWIVTDAQGQQTQVVLNGLETNVELDPALFRWRDPTLFGWPKG